jgi:hypothetical protein
MLVTDKETGPERYEALVAHVPVNSRGGIVPGLTTDPRDVRMGTGQRA